MELAVKEVNFGRVLHSHLEVFMLFLKEVII